MISKLEKLKRLLWDEWDPIGVNHDPDATDEYDNYAFEIFVRLEQGQGRSELLEYLNWVETEHMGLKSGGKNSAIVERILEIHRSNT